ncbi:MAG: NAD+ synthase [Nitrospiraceae bacterium]|nr:MAG: NAD+ synthase [Nitrospiraceae bacterium]
MKKIRIVLAQINPTVGDLPGNVKKIISCMKRAREARADIIAFPELAVTGYPPEDLLLSPDFIEDNMDALEKIVQASKGITAFVGFVDRADGICNAAAVLSNGSCADVYHKMHLPNYGVFDEYRYFRPGRRYPVYHLGNVVVGVNICEDIWHEDTPSRIQAAAGADVIININASPYHMGKAVFREKLVRARSRESGAAMVYVNMVGGQDELVFDGGSFVVDAEGNLLVKGNQFREELITVDLAISGDRETAAVARSRPLKSLRGKGTGIEKINLAAPARGKKPGYRNRKYRMLSEHEEVYEALVLGAGDYVRKNGFRGVVIGMSGGIDSALVATIAVDALGKDNVHGLFMPSMYTSKESREDTFGHAGNLGIKVTAIPIGPLFRSYLKLLAKHFAGLPPDITEENLQARIRGNLLMAFSNKFRWLVLTTGNKSEMSVGYATLYGDMAGGFAVIKDVPKTLVYKLCEWRNRKAGRELIPARVLWKEPTAELKPDQRDTDTLPPYQVLDPILKAYVEEDRSFEEILNMGCDAECAKRVIAMIDHSEYKRRQAPPGIKITPRAFGKDRRFPITNRYKSF